MEMKRKRSADGCDSSSDSMEIPAHLNSRTFKRFRDPRPPEQEVHERTLGLLYSAQQRPLAHAGFHLGHQDQPPPASPFAPTASHPHPHPHTDMNASVNTSTRTQQSLHRFWDIKAEPSADADASMITGTTAQPPSGCEDCGGALSDSQAPMSGGAGTRMNAGMALDTCTMGMDRTGMPDADVEETRCGACGKYVCFSCSVSDLGERRRCLRCAERMGRGRGVGWSAGVSHLSIS